jgi:hypothetical protein
MLEMRSGYASLAEKAYAQTAKSILAKDWHAWDAAKTMFVS